MPKLSDIRRIIPEDFPRESQEVAERIGGSYNEFADEVYGVINGLLDFENLARSAVTLEITFLENGNPKAPVTINSGLANVTMLHIGKVANVSNSSARFTQSPYLDWTFLGNGLVRINYGVGFIPGAKYRFVLELIQ